MARFNKQPWKVRKARRVHSYPELLNGHGDVIAAVYGGDDCAAYLVDLPKFHNCLKRMVAAASMSASTRQPFALTSPVIKDARALLEAHA